MRAETIWEGLLLPELRLVEFKKRPRGEYEVYAEKESEFEVCPGCAKPCRRVYDRRWIRVKDEPIRRHPCRLWVKKRRFRCDCGKVFTEPVGGIRKGARSTERFRKACVEAAERYSCLKTVCDDFRCSSGYVYQAYYQHLRRKEKERKTDWPFIVGVDEHAFKKNPYARPTFVTMVVNMKGKSLFDVVLGKSIQNLQTDLAHHQGAEQVRWVTMDMAEGYRSFAKQTFPQAQIVADKFHILRYLSAPLMKQRKAIVGKKADLRARRLLLCDAKKLDFRDRGALASYLERYPTLKALWIAQQRMHGFYRIKGYKRACRALQAIIEDFRKSEVSVLQRFARTLKKWKDEICHYFLCRLTNARVEGFNNKAKLVKRRAYGYTSFENYRARLLNVCRA